MTTCVIYARVSTEEQAIHGQSIEAQVTKLSAYAMEKKYQLISIFKDEGLSGTSDNRPALKDMLALCQRDKINKLLVVDTDRIARNESLHFAIKAILKKCNTAVESINQPMIDESPEGAFLDTILAAVNAFQPKITGRKTSMTLEEKVKGGWWPGWAPTGYTNKPNPEPQGKLDKNIIVPQELMGQLITRLFELFAKGTYTIYTLADQISAEGLLTRGNKPLRPGDVAHILKNPFYIGKIAYKGKVYQGGHQPLIDELTFYKCQRLLADHNRHADRTRKHQFVLAGAIYCGKCNGLYTAEHHPKKARAYYHCSTRLFKHSNKGQNIEADQLEDKVADLFEQLQLPDFIVDKIISKARTIIKNSHSDIDIRRKLMESRKSKVMDKRNLLERKLLDSIITDDTYIRQSGLLNIEIECIETDLLHLNEDRNDNIKVFEQLIFLARNIHTAYIEAPLDLKRKYLRLFWEKIIVEDRKIKEAVPTKLFQAVLGVSSFTTPSNGAGSGHSYNQFDMAPEVGFEPTTLRLH